MSRLAPDPDSLGHNLVELLLNTARRHPDKGIRIYNRRATDYEFRSYPLLLETARRGAARWKTLGIQSEDRIIVCLPNSWSWMEAWFGAVFTGALPVAMAPAAALTALDGMVQKIAGIAELLDARKIICDASLIKQAQDMGNSFLLERMLTPDDFLATAPSGMVQSSTTEDPGSTAFLQLTSGSTGWPRAVRISQRAAIHNPVAIADAIAASDNIPFSTWAQSVVSWLPLNHDMGLVGCLLFSIAHGLNLSLLRPDTFLFRPLNWLHLFAESGASLAPAPNFAYQSCVERIAEKDRLMLDLSGWKAAMTGAEMIRPETCGDFIASFESSGFSPSAFRPCFGLAEGTLAVTFDRIGKGVRTRTLPEGVDPGMNLSAVVSTGAGVLDTKINITSPDGQSLSDGKIGVVRAKGPGIFSGYFNDREATAESLKDGWLCTGDLGFLHDGELYLTGRTKDLLIVHGHNIMPHEIEWTAESVAGAGGTERTGAFSITKGSQGEVAVLIVETSERNLDKLGHFAHDIKLAVGKKLGLPLADLVFVKRGQIPKTTSGKVQRKELRSRYLDGSLQKLD